jgi:hypothetical protein
MNMNTINGLSGELDNTIYDNINRKLDYFYNTMRVPHIIFHGSSGSGKRTIVFAFLNKIYGGDKHKLKTNVMVVNCAHGKGIKFIREDLKNFAKTNSLTIDAQSALRRCIELFSYNTRFFIVVENKQKLLNPILSRFCEIYVPEQHSAEGEFVNLHEKSTEKVYAFFDEDKGNAIEAEIRRLDCIKDSANIHNALLDASTRFYESGFSCLDVINAIRRMPEWTNEQKNITAVFYQKIKSEFRFEKMCVFYVLDVLLFGCDIAMLKEVSFI